MRVLVFAVMATAACMATASSLPGMVADVSIMSGLAIGWGLCENRNDTACGGPTSTTSDQRSVLMTMTFNVGTYGSVGMAPTGMIGRAVSCALPDNVASRAVCILLATTNFDVTTQAAVSIGSFSTNATSTFVLFSASTSPSTGKSSVTFRIDKSLIWGEASGGPQRGQFAVGPYSNNGLANLWSSLNSNPTKRLATTAQPTSQHDSQTTGVIDLAVPGVFTKVSFVVIPYVVVVVVLVCIGVIAQFVFRFVDPLASAGPITNMIAHGSMAVILLIVFPIIVLVLSSTQYQDQVATAPWFRAVGEMAVYGFMIVLLPVCHRVSLPAIFLRTSYERSTGMHALLGIFILLTVTVHGVGMALKGVDSLSDVFSANTPKKNILGVFAWVLLVIMSIPALLRGRGIPKMFAAFRATHLLNIFVIGCGAIHCPKLIIVLLPGLVLYLGDVAWRTYQVYSANRNSYVTEAEYNAEAGVTALQIKCHDLIKKRHRGSDADESNNTNDDADSYSNFLLQSAGKHVLLRIGDLGILSHPISIALMDPRRGVITLFIKNTAASTGAAAAASRPDPSSHRWTERLAAMATRSAQGLVAPEGTDNESSSRGTIFTASVLTLLDSTAVVPLHTLIGGCPPPSCCFQKSSSTLSPSSSSDLSSLSSTHVRRIVLVAGGIGITPVLSYLQGLSSVSRRVDGERRDHVANDVPIPTTTTTTRRQSVSITVVWSVREIGMQAYFEPLLLQLVDSIKLHLAIPFSEPPITACCCHPSSSSSPPSILEVSSVSLHIFQTRMDTPSLPSVVDDSLGAVLHREMSTVPPPHTTTTFVPAPTTVGDTTTIDDEDDRNDSNDDQTVMGGHPANGARNFSIHSSSTSLTDVRCVSPIISDVDDDDCTPTGAKDALRFLPHNFRGPHQRGSFTTTTVKHYGRPSVSILRDIIMMMATDIEAATIPPPPMGGGGAVYACGPAGIMDVAKKLATDIGLLYHYEAFD